VTNEIRLRGNSKIKFSNNDVIEIDLSTVDSFVIMCEISGAI
jgi:hypothetical protein